MTICACVCPQTGQVHRTFFGVSTTVALFFLRYGRSRSKARSLHEKKLLVRKLLHGRRWSHAAWQIIKTKHKPKTQGKTQIPRFASHHPKTQQSKQRTGQEPNKNNHTRFAKDTVVKTHCVAINSKTCSKRISSHPETWDMRSTLLRGRQQKVVFTIILLTKPASQSPLTSTYSRAQVQRKSKYQRA